MTAPDAACRDSILTARPAFCGKTMSINKTVVKAVVGVNFVMCLGCTLDQLDDDDRVAAAVELLRRLQDVRLGKEVSA